MRKLILLFLFVSTSLWLHAKDFTRYVSPLVGTQSTFELSTGTTYPAIARPWGMNFWTPQTGKMGDGWQYVYTANKSRGFKQDVYKRQTGYVMFQGHGMKYMYRWQKLINM